MGVTNKEVATNIFWRYSERMLAQIVSFIVSLVLARILSPDDYGTVALIIVLINILDTFTTKGFNQALIQKKEIDHLDYSTIFFTNIFISVLLYALIYIAAPFIADFYNNSNLIVLTRVLSIRILFSSLNTVQQAYVQRNMIFKKFFLSTFAGTSISGIIGIIMALNGCGIWSLIAQSILNTAIDTTVLFFTIDWKPKLEYSFYRLKGMMKFGLNMLFMGLLESLYNEIRALVIGKFYSESDLAYYNRGEQLPKMIIQNIQISASNVMFSSLSRENYKEAVKEKMREYLRIMFYIVLPMLLGLAAIAEPVISILFSQKWISAAPYMIIYCFIYVNWVIQIPLLQAMNSLGQTDITLRLCIMQRIVGVFSLILLLNKGTIFVAISALVTDVFMTLITYIACSKSLNYTIKELISDISKTVISALIMVVIINLVGSFIKITILKLLFEIVLGICVYMLLSYVLNNSAFIKLKSAVLAFLKK